MPKHRIIEYTENGWDFASEWAAAAIIVALVLLTAWLETVL